MYVSLFPGTQLCDDVNAFTQSLLQTKSTTIDKENKIMKECEMFSTSLSKLIDLFLS